MRLRHICLGKRQAKDKQGKVSKGVCLQVGEETHAERCDGRDGGCSRDEIALDLSHAQQVIGIGVAERVTLSGGTDASAFFYNTPMLA